MAQPELTAAGAVLRTAVNVLEPTGPAASSTEILTWGFSLSTTAFAPFPAQHLAHVSQPYELVEPSMARL